VLLIADGPTFARHDPGPGHRERIARLDAVGIVARGTTPRSRRAPSRSRRGPATTIVFLEGGYDLAAVRDSVSATLPVLLDTTVTPAEAPTGGGPGADAVAAAGRQWAARA